MATLQGSRESRLPTRTASMQAAVITGPRTLTLADVPLPEPGPNEIRVRLEGCGVCASNLPSWEGRPGITYPLQPGALGHEGWGYIDALGPDVSSFTRGDRVAILSQHAYAQFDLASIDAAVRLPVESGTYPFPAEPLGCAFNVLHRGNLSSGQTVAIVGIGFLGALLTRIVSHAGARVIALSRRPFALHFATSYGAAETLLIEDPPSIVRRVQELTDHQLCDTVIEATGWQPALDLAAQLTAQRGRLVIAGYHQDGLRTVDLQLWNRRGLDVINAHDPDPALHLRGMQQAVQAVSSGLLDPNPLYTHLFPLDALPTALALTRDRPHGFMKALIMM